ncbi:MAG: GIY-YIG nuclease family protein [Fischerella sp. CENA71]|nr:GIY-YIG nuclease family protein [Fischerella sp. CENA71]
MKCLAVAIAKSSQILLIGWNGILVEENRESMRSHYTTYTHHHQPGYIYLMEALGYHGLIPGCFLRRCKIGLSRNPQLRLQKFHDNQPPCDIKILKTIYVKDMEAVETELHRQFNRCRVKLIKSREWFDLTPWQFAMVHWAMSRCDSRSNNGNLLVSVKLILACLLVLAGAGVMLGQQLNQQAQQSDVESQRYLEHY